MESQTTLGYVTESSCVVLFTKWKTVAFRLSQTIPLPNSRKTRHHCLRRTVAFL